jgi:hypothetical protein
MAYALRLLLLKQGPDGFQLHIQQDPASITYKLLRILPYGIIYAFAGFITVFNQAGPGGFQYCPLSN